MIGASTTWVDLRPVGPAGGKFKSSLSVANSNTSYSMNIGLIGAELVRIRTPYPAHRGYHDDIFKKQGAHGTRGTGICHTIPLYAAHAYQHHNIVLNGTTKANDHDKTMTRSGSTQNGGKTRSISPDSLKIRTPWKPPLSGARKIARRKAGRPGTVAPKEIGQLM